jgi:WD40 repeat protein
LVRLWDVASGEELQRLEGHGSWVRTVAFLPDGRRALSGGLDATMRLWDLETGRELQQFKPERWVWGVCASPDGHTALAALANFGKGGANFVSLVDLDHNEVRRFEGHSTGVTSVAFSPDGRRAVSGAYDGTVRLWDVATGREIQRGFDHRNGVWSVAFLPDGQRILSAGGGMRSATQMLPGYDFAIRLWSVTDKAGGTPIENGN